MTRTLAAASLLVLALAACNRSDMPPAMKNAIDSTKQSIKEGREANEKETQRAKEAAAQSYQSAKEGAAKAAQELREGVSDPLKK